MKEEYRPLFPVGLLFIVVSKTNENVCFLHKQHLIFPKDLMFSRSVLWTRKWGDLCKGLDPYLSPSQTLDPQPSQSCAVWLP